VVGDRPRPATAAEGPSEGADTHHAGSVRDGFGLRAEEQRARRKAAGAQAGAALWRPIDTAPKDGTPLLGACSEEQGMTFCGAAFWETCGYRPERVPLSRRVVPTLPRSILVAPNALRPYAEGVWGD